MNKIRLEHGQIAVLTKLLGTNRTSVRYALRGAMKTPLALRIRKKALELGGVEVPTKK